MNQFFVRKKIRLPIPAYDKGHAFFVTISTYKKFPWFQKQAFLCESAIELMRSLANDSGIIVYAWCFMPDHMHLLIQGKSIIDFIRLLKGKMTPVARSIERSRRLWQRSFYDHALRKEESLSEVACYIWENPVRAGIVDKPKDYSWSGSEVWPKWDKYYL